MRVSTLSPYYYIQIFICKEYFSSRRIYVHANIHTGIKCSYIHSWESYMRVFIHEGVMCVLKVALCVPRVQYECIIKITIISE